MPIEHILTQSDTLQSLAEVHMGDPLRWVELAEYNNLSEPYIVGTSEEKNNNFGRGYVTVHRSNYTTALSIPVGWTFRTRPAIIGGLVKTFTVTEATSIPPGHQVGYVHVRCTVPGTFGNVPPNTILEAGREFTEANVEFNTVTNDYAFTGGRDTQVLTIGDSIYIPTEDTRYIEAHSLEKISELIGGEDLALAPGTGYARTFEVDGYGDVRSVSGLENIKQAINDRLMTEKGELPLHPEYGTNLPQIIGSARLPYTQKMVELEIYDALSYEDRIENVQVARVSIVGTTVEAFVRFNPASMDREASMQLSLNYSSSRGGTTYV